MIDKILKKYNLKGEIIRFEKTGSGHINKTFLVVLKTKKEEKKYIVQQINNSIFKEPNKLMNNIEGVVHHLKKKMELENDTKHKVLEIVKTKDHKNLCYILNESHKREYYRVYKYIENAISYDTSIDTEIVFNTGKAFGSFQKLLQDYPMDKLEETIKNFHDTNKRYHKLLKDIQLDPVGRVKEVTKEIEFVKEREELYPVIINALKNKKIPYRVTHNDTKVNNVMMDKNTNDFIAVIDLDTVMPGSMLFDYGDGVRSTCATAGEAETDLNKVSINLEIFKAYTDGYMSEMASSLKQEEVSLMMESIRMMVTESVIRFLDDYICGDTYFRIAYEKHNLDRTRNQLKLEQEIEKHYDEMNDYILKSYQKYKA